MDDRLVLVDEQDREVGTIEKIRAHTDGRLHRAFSVMIFDAQQRLLLQRRALQKYHSGGLWSNTCCGHPRPGEEVADGARRRLREEMGIDCTLRPAFAFTYQSAVGNGLVENEYDHVLVGEFAGYPQPDPNEVEAWRWVTLPDLVADIAAHSDRYTVWLRPALDGLLERKATVLLNL